MSIAYSCDASATGREQGRAHHGCLRAHGRGARKGQGPRQIHLAEISRRDARLLGREVPVVVQVEAEIGHRRGHAQVDLASVGVQRIRAVQASLTRARPMRKSMSSERSVPDRACPDLHLADGEA